MPKEKYSDPGFWLALAAFALTLAAFWPGYLSWDSAYQWAQARGAVPLDPAHPPVMVRTWIALRALLPDPGGVFAVQATLWWAAVALFAHALGGSAWRRGFTVLLLGAWPPLLALLPHLWKDVWMTALFALALACLAMELRGGRRIAWLAAALLALAAGIAFRSNAITAALPLLAWIGWRATGDGRSTPSALSSGNSRRRATRQHLLRAGAATMVAGIVAVGGAALANFSTAKPMPVWPAIALWDMAAVSIEADELLFPSDWIEPTLTVADLRRDFDPSVNVPSFVGGQLRLNFYYDYTPAQYAELRDAWLALPREHPRAYFAHRARVSAFLFGLRQAEHADGLVLSPDITAFADNPPLQRNDGALNRWLQPKLSALVDTPVFAGWVYLLLAAGLVLRWLWRRDGGFGALSGITALSSLALAAPLVLAAPSSDFRYLMWSVAASLFALALTAGKSS
ncbi:hypothetical protein [Arenimonas composti]|uniref:Glycosyltransferase RgtA/B/C/D-like domain-containing protein n=1 Tax=Arenimonas composti TR7-09 = DSM 18010 TaxID=1121013 RepID=A0A091BAH2_9GAMM|nr:hypothetical protein [Arenimonas composti]KFN48746.1 hypothetical protein P873_13900 [Arenimonas composti TR7-09 = DSM 18010]